WKNPSGRNSFQNKPRLQTVESGLISRDLEHSRPARAYSGTESATSFPLTTLTNRYRLSRKIIVSSFSPSVTVKTSCPIIPSYFANSIVYRDFLGSDLFLKSLIIYRTSILRTGVLAAVSPLSVNTCLPHFA